MTIELIEGAIDALAGYLQDNWAAKYAELNARYADDYDITDFKEWYIGNLPQAVPGQPSIVLQAQSWSPEYQREANVTGNTRLDMVVFVGDNVVEARFRRLCRYALGLVELLQGARAETGYHINVSGPVLLTDIIDTPEFLQGVIVPVTMGKTESFS